VSCNNQQTEKSTEKTEQVTVLEPTENTDGSIAGLFGGCGYNYTPDKTTITVYQPRQRELEQINSILKFSGLSSNFIIYSSPIENAVATIINNKRYILYDPKLLSYSDGNSGNYWSSMSILAHEIGHHLSGHTLTNKGSNPSDELEADKFSGFVLYKLGSSLEQATAAMQNLGSENDSYSHPSKYKRIQSITKGWKEASEQRYESAVPPPPVDDNNFGAEGYIKDEFSKDELISEAALSAENFGGVINSYNHPTLEGIIIDVTKEDPSGGGRTEYFNEEKSEFNFVITIQLTKVNPSPFGDSRKVGNREKFHLLDYYQMSHADLSWLEALIVPGRKIRFKSFYFGYGGEDIFYIKKLNRNGASTSSTNEATVSGNVANIATNYVVKTDKAFFYSQPNMNDRKKAYLVYGETVSITKVQNGFAFTNFINQKGQRTTGWILLSDLTN
jgi:hypothetical protein